MLTTYATSFQNYSTRAKELNYVSAIPHTLTHKTTKLETLSSSIIFFFFLISRPKKNIKRKDENWLKTNKEDKETKRTRTENDFKQTKVRA